MAKDPVSTGHKNKLYVNTGTVASPTWSEISEIGDASLDGFDRNMAELQRRASSFTKGLVGTLSMFTFNFFHPHGLGATRFDALRAAFLDGTPDEYAIMNGNIATVGNEGFRCPMAVTSFPWNQALNDPSGHDFTLTLAYMEESATEVDPSWLTVSS